MKRRPILNAIMLGLREYGPRDAGILKHRWGLAGPPRNYDEIAAQFGISNSRVAEIERKALAELRAANAWPSKLPGWVEGKSVADCMGEPWAEGMDAYALRGLARAVGIELAGQEGRRGKHERPSRDFLERLVSKTLEPGSLTNSEVSRKTGIGRGFCGRILTRLEERGIVVKSGLRYSLADSQPDATELGRRRLRKVRAIRFLPEEEIQAIHKLRIPELYGLPYGRFFAEDAFGDLFFDDGSTVRKVVLTTDEIEHVADGIDRFADAILADPNYLTGARFLAQWEAENGALPKGSRLGQVIPILMNGDFVVENFKAVPAIEARRYACLVVAAVRANPGSTFRIFGTGDRVRIEPVRSQ